MGKKWCPTCKFMTYGSCHPVEPLRVPPDIKLAPPSRLILIPFDLPCIYGNASTSISVTPQIAGRPLHLAVAPECADSFDITDIKIGRNSQIAAVGPIRASLFPPVPKDKAWMNNLQGMESWKLGMILTLCIRNLCPYARTFNALLRAEQTTE